MFWLRLIYSRLYGLLRKNRIEQEMDDEMRFHLLMRTRENIERGMRPDEAEREARRRFGNVGRIKDLARDIKGGGFMETLLQDLRYGARMLLRHKGFTIVAAGALALGIGANTVIFTVVNAVLLNPFAYPDADRIMFLSNYALSQPEHSRSVSYPNFLDWQKQQTVFTHLAAARNQTFNLTGGDEPIQVSGAIISPEAFPLLAVQPYLGRVFTELDSRPDSARTVALSYAFWQRRFGGDSGAIGRTMLLDNQVYTIIGVMPPRFKFWWADVWVPYGLFGNEASVTSRMVGVGNGVVGRLKAGVTIAQARAEMSAIAARLGEQYPESNKDVGARITPLIELITRDIRQSLLALQGAVALVLLIACANVANLLIARSATREKELAIRSALGAGRSRLIRQLLLECLPLALLGGLAGLLLARWGLELLLKLLPDDIIPAEARIGIDARALCFTSFLTLLTTLICSLLPALRFSRSAVLEGLKDGARPGAGAPGNQRMRGALVTLEVALSVVLLIGAGLLIKSFARMQQVDLGFRREFLLTIDLSLPSGKYSQQRQAELFYREALERVNATPGIESAAFISGGPFSNSGAAVPFVREGESFTSLQELSGRLCRYFITHGDAVSALGSPLIAGRGFTPQDTMNSQPVVIISQAAAEKHFPGENPLGKRIRLGLPDNLIQPGMLPPGMSKPSWLMVVGVVKNLRQFGLGQEPQVAGYRPLAQAPPGSMLLIHSSTLLARTTKDPVSLVNALRRQIHSVDPDLPLAQVATAESLTDNWLKTQRFNTFLMGLFAALALLLAMVGLYGVLSYTIVQRRHEIGVRMALGAQVSDVLRLVIRQGMTLTLIGIMIGLIAALGLTRWIKNLLFGVSATDPVTFFAIALLFAAVALLACYLPARRATKVDPMVALRSE